MMFVWKKCTDDQVILKHEAKNEKARSGLVAFDRRIS